MRRILLLALVASLALSATAQKKKAEKRELPDQVLRAQYVYITGWHGTEYEFRTLPEERAAINNVQRAVREWGRYHVVFRPEEADIMLVVKPGHLGMVQGGVNVGSGRPDITAGTPQIGPTPSGTTGIGYGAEGGNPDDVLMVSLFPSANVLDANYIWRRSSRNGFEGRKVPLFEEFRKAVGESEKAAQAAKKP